MYSINNFVKMNFFRYTFLFLILQVVCFFSVSGSELKTKDTTIILNGQNTLLSFTSKPVIGTILLLQGWNFPPTDWCQRTDICEVALEKGYNIVMPDMGKSMYHSQVFKETRKDWLKYPTRKWLVDSLMEYLKNEFNLFEESKRNFIVGLSTGARGAVLIAMDCPKLFKGVAALSGDYNQLDMLNDNLAIGFYGAYNYHKERWRVIDNPYTDVSKLKTPIYLAHGLDDRVVPSSQTIKFYKALVKKNPILKIKLHLPKLKHDYLFWKSEVVNIFIFFDSL